MTDRRVTEDGAVLIPLKNGEIVRIESASATLRRLKRERKA